MEHSTQSYAQVVLTRIDAQWLMTDCTQAFLEMTGFSLDDLHNRFQSRFCQMISAADLSAVDTYFTLGGQARLCPWIFTLSCAKKGRTLPILLQLIPIKESEEALRLYIHDASFLGEQTTKIGKRIRSLENSIPSGLCQVLFDDDFTIIWHNAHYLNMIGYTREQFVNELGCKANGYLTAQDSALIAQKLNAAVAQGQRELTIETHVKRRDGELRWFLISMSLTDETVGGVPVLYSVAIDVTDQKRAHELEMDAQRLKMAMDQVSSYILEYDVPARRLLASQSLQRYFGISGDADNVPDSLIETGLIAPQSHETLRRLFKQIHEGASRAEEMVCLRGNAAGIQDIWFQLRLTAVFDDAGRPVKAILLAEDVTERYEMEMRYREEENRRVAMTYDMSFSFQLNLSTETILSANKAKFPFFDFESSRSSRLLIRCNAAEYVHPDDRAEYLRKLSIDHMLRQFEHGVPEITLDFRTASETGAYHWCRGVVHMIREPIRGDICAYIYTKDIEDEKRRELDLRRHAEQDALTGLYNRYTAELLCDRMLEMQNGKGLCAMYMLDLDNFKYLNDSYGHSRGDEMLRQSAQSLREIFGETALVGRIGGDELIVFQPDCGGVQHAEEMAQLVCDTLHRLEAGASVVTASVGIAFAPRDGRTYCELYHCSDNALYHAKRAGKNRWAVFEKEDREPPRKEERLPVSREWLLEESNDIIYVCDFYSYDMLYMNLGARTLFHITDDNYIGRKCYEVLQHKDQPCEFCTNHLLCREQFYCWEFRNQTVGRSLLLRDRIVDWYGTPARIEFATDVSELDRRNQALEEQVKLDKMLIGCLRALGSIHPFAAAAEKVLKLLAEFYGADRAFILNYDSSSNLLQPNFEWSRDGVGSMGKDEFEPTCQIRACLESRTNYLFERTNHLRESEPVQYNLLNDAGVTCQRGVPFYLDNQPAGIIGLDNPTAYQDELTALETLSYFISDELSKANLSDSLAFLSYHDALTGLWNRNRYIEYLEGMKTAPIRSLGVAVADLNALKDINKLRGHTYGDLVVKRAAELLRDGFPGAQIFRLSGDEFVIHSEDIEHFAFLDQVKQVCENAPHLQGHGIAVGYAWTDRNIDCAKLTTQATDIMIMNKREYYQYNKTTRAAGKHDHARLQKLLDCISGGLFKMYLQPKADCSRFCLSGAEALVRFESPEHGLVPPGRFIALLEQEHMIQFVDLFMFEEVCKLLARWKRDGRRLLTVSLNFSRQTVLEPDLLKTMLTLADRYDIPKDCIEVEITETIGDYESLTIGEIGAGIKAAGFRLALDDFGSHYTNMAMLSAVPANVLKLDRGLIQNILASQSNQLVLKSILSLCRELGISSIAEGVETNEQLELLRKLQCDDIQGYLFGKPTTVDNFEKKYFHES